MSEPFLIPPGSRVTLADHDPGYSGEYRSKGETKPALKRNVERLRELQEVLWAEGKHSLLVVLQAMDAGGKDGTIKHVMRGVNPQGCQVTSFKVPIPEELGHDFLWRVHEAVPRRGYIGIFNRSHYEDVLVVRVHGLVPEEVWQQRYEQINNFEEYLYENGIVIIKFFLHVSKEEQKKRFLKRIGDPAKNWKFSSSDIEERKYWDEYQKVYQEAISATSKKYSPWYIIPADKKWFARLLVSEIIVREMKRLKPEFPKLNDEQLQDLEKSKQSLLNE